MISSESGSLAHNKIIHVCDDIIKNDTSTYFYTRIGPTQNARNTLWYY